MMFINIKVGERNHCSSEFLLHNTTLSVDILSWHDEVYFLEHPYEIIRKQILYN